MSKRNEEIVRRFYDVWSRDEFPGPLALTDPDIESLMNPEIEYVNPSGAIEPGVRRGIEAFRAAAAKMFEGWEWWRMEPERITAVGDQVAVVVRYRARGRASGVEVEGRESALFTVRDGKIVRYEWFHEPDDAHDALNRQR